MLTVITEKSKKMETRDHIRNLFLLYQKKKFSIHGRQLFGRWLRAPQDKEAKEQCLKDLWVETHAETTEETHAEWEKFIHKIAQPSDKPQRIHLIQWSKYSAAAILLVLLSISGTYWFTSQNQVNQETEMVEYFHPRGKAKEITLADNSRIWVKGGTLLIYPKDFGNKSQRTVYLSGEASFKVSKNKDKPFVVKTANVDVQVLGTTFNVEAYPEDSLTTTTLEEGSVLVAMKDEKHSSTILKPNEQLVYSNRNKTATIRNVDTTPFEMERQGFMVFENATFKQIIAALEREYNVTIRCAFTPNETEQYRLKLSPDESLEDALQVFCQLAGINYRISGDLVILS